MRELSLGDRRLMRQYLASDRYQSPSVAVPVMFRHHCTELYAILLPHEMICNNRHAPIPVIFRS